jgi:hypothetical protein
MDTSASSIAAGSSCTVAHADPETIHNDAVVGFILFETKAGKVSRVLAAGSALDGADLRTSPSAPLDGQVLTLLPVAGAVTTGGATSLHTLVSQIDGAKTLAGTPLPLGLRLIRAAEVAAGPVCWAPICAALKRDRSDIHRFDSPQWCPVASGDVAGGQSAPARVDAWLAIHGPTGGDSAGVKLGLVRHNKLSVVSESNAPAPRASDVSHGDHIAIVWPTPVVTPAAASTASASTSGRLWARGKPAVEAGLFMRD